MGQFRSWLGGEIKLAFFFGIFLLGSSRLPSLVFAAKIFDLLHFVAKISHSHCSSIFHWFQHFSIVFIESSIVFIGLSMIFFNFSVGSKESKKAKKYPPIGFPAKGVELSALLAQDYSEPEKVVDELRTLRVHS